MVFEIDLSDDLERSAGTARKKPIRNDGGKNDRLGIAFEEVFKRLVLNGNDKILDWLGVSEDNIVDVITGKKIKDYTYNSKIDLIIITKKNKMCFSLKCSGAGTVGALETSLEKIAENVKLGTLEYISFKRFTKNGYKLKGMPKHNVVIIRNYFSQHFQDFLDFVIKGKYRNEDTLQVKYIAFYDKKKHMLYINTVDRYISLVSKYGAAGTFGSRMSVTYTSGKSKRFKFKIRNPFNAIQKERRNRNAESENRDRRHGYAGRNDGIHGEKYRYPSYPQGIRKKCV